MCQGRAFDIRDKGCRERARMRIDANPLDEVLNEHGHGEPSVLIFLVKRAGPWFVAYLLPRQTLEDNMPKTRTILYVATEREARRSV